MPSEKKLDSYFYQWFQPVLASTAQPHPTYVPHQTPLQTTTLQAYAHGAPVPFNLTLSNPYGCGGGRGCSTGGCRLGCSGGAYTQPQLLLTQLRMVPITCQIGQLSASLSW
eukprot:10070990-Ditylum_brightwellii.AAC.2